jgi:hypothetical protein
MAEEDYLLVLGQDIQGCDYTIGCGNRYETISLPTNNPKLYFEKLKEATIEYYTAQEHKLSQAYVIPMRHVIALPVKDWYAEAERNKQRHEDEMTMRKELAELERLKRKYGNV